MQAKKMSGQRGSVLMSAVVLLVFAVPLVIGGLKVAQALSKDSIVKTDIIKRQYAALGAGEYSRYRLVYEEGYAASLGSGPQTYSVTLNGKTVTVTDTLPASQGSSPDPPDLDSSRRFTSTKTVVPATASPNVLTYYTYTARVQNKDTVSRNITKIKDTLPQGFAYVAGSSSGVTIVDPNISCCSNGQGPVLSWNFGGGGVEVAPGASVTLTFQASASVAQGAYCNEVQVDPGGDKTSSGPTALVVVGSPAIPLCPDEALTVTKTASPNYVGAGSSVQITYSISMQNMSAVTLSLKKVEDLLPEGLLYVAGSTSGTLTSQDPNTAMKQGSQELKWDFSPDISLAAGATATLVFGASANSLAAGIYWNQAWVDVADIPQLVYTWPTAPVEAMTAVESLSTVDGQTTSLNWELWLGEQSSFIGKWHLEK